MHYSVFDVLKKISNETLKYYMPEKKDQKGYGLINLYCQISNIRCALFGNKNVNHSGVAGASPVGAAPTTSSFAI